MSTLRKLVLGETWTVPVGVALTLSAALVLRGAGWWVGFVILAGAILTLVASTLKTGYGTTDGIP
ncbi:MAG TPA: hypothetical protein VFZ00_18085 [Solirubrobacter sp.]|jgi:hypothetical protein|nr:hypothetical protein [Solirubrobacter sp.]